MAVLGSKGAGWKVSSFTKSLFCGVCGAASLDLRPVNESQLESLSVSQKLAEYINKNKEHT